MEVNIFFYIFAYNISIEMDKTTERNQYYFSLNINYTDKIDLIKKAIKVYACVDNMNRNGSFLSERAINVLSFYIVYGYSKETKNKIKEVLGISTENLNQINSILTKNGFLIRSNFNFRVNKVCDDLNNLGRYLLHKKIVDKEMSINFVNII